MYPTVPGPYLSLSKSTSLLHPHCIRPVFPFPSESYPRLPFNQAISFLLFLFPFLPSPEKSPLKFPSILGGAENGHTVFERSLIYVLAHPPRPFPIRDWSASVICYWASTGTTTTFAS